MARSRSEQMARIRSTDTTPERLLRAALWAEGLRYRLQFKTPVGRPDVVFPALKVAVFIDGCQWHGCPLHYVFPRTRREFWSAKLRENVLRDARQTVQLEADGWRILRVWEHDVFTDCAGVVARVRKLLEGAPSTTELDYRVIMVEALDGPDDLEKRHLRDLRDEFTQLVDEKPRSTGKWSRKSVGD